MQPKVEERPYKLRRALRRIARSEPRPRRDRHFDREVIESLQRIAQVALRNWKES